YALINGLMTRDGTTRRKRIPTSVNSPTLTPAASALIHNITGTKVNKTAKAIIITAIIIIGMISITLIKNSSSIHLLVIERQFSYLLREQFLLAYLFQ